MQINQIQKSKLYLLFVLLIGAFFLLPSKAFAQESPIKIIQEIYSFYQPQSNNGIDITDPQNSHFFSPDFLNVIKEDEKLTSAQGDGRIIDYDFICNCQDTMDGIIVRNIEILQQTSNTARVKVSFDFILNGSDNVQKDELFSNDHPGQQQTYFNLINHNKQWVIDDVTDAKNIGIKKGWKEELRKYYNSSIQ